MSKSTIQNQSPQACLLMLLTTTIFVFIMVVRL